MLALCYSQPACTYNPLMQRQQVRRGASRALGAPVSAGMQFRSRGTLNGSPGACSSSSSATFRSTPAARTDTLSASLRAPAGLC